MTARVVIPPAGGELIGDSAERRVEILSDHEALNATWSRFGPRRDGADLHIHRQHTDLFYVLDGELTVSLGAEDESVVVPAGTLARVPPLVVHGFRNGSDADVRYLNFHAPGQRFADFLRAARDGRTLVYDQYPPPADGARPPTDAVVGGAEVVVDEPGLRVTLHTDVDEIAVSEISTDGSVTPDGPHVHRRHVESIFVLEGELELTVDGGTLRAEAGSWVQIPPGVPHAFGVGANDRGRFLEVHAPSCGFGAFLRGVGATRRAAQAAAAEAAFDRVSA